MTDLEGTKNEERTTSWGLVIAKGTRPDAEGLKNGADFLIDQTI
jgi:hypothetical protein